MRTHPPGSPLAENEVQKQLLRERSGAIEEFTVLYADGRGVHRVYRMNFADRQWTMWRNASGFHQRFSGSLSNDDATIDAKWERSVDGTARDPDFGLTYHRQA